MWALSGPWLKARGAHGWALGSGWRYACPPTGAGFWVGTGGKGARVPAWDAQGCGAARPASAESPPSTQASGPTPPLAVGHLGERGRDTAQQSNWPPAGQPGGRGDRDRKGERSGSCHGGNTCGATAPLPSAEATRAERPRRADNRGGPAAEAVAPAWQPAPSEGAAPWGGGLCPCGSPAPPEGPFFGWGGGFPSPEL